MVKLKSKSHILAPFREPKEKNENDVQKSEVRILSFYIFCRSKKGRRKDEKVKRKRTNAKTKQEENL